MRAAQIRAGQRGEQRRTRPMPRLRGLNSCEEEWGGEPQQAGAGRGACEGGRVKRATCCHRGRRRDSYRRTEAIFTRMMSEQSCGAIVPDDGRQRLEDEGGGGQHQLLLPRPTSAAVAATAAGPHPASSTSSWAPTSATRAPAKPQPARRKRSHQRSVGEVWWRSSGRGSVCLCPRL
ncbi:unnamed protein product [Pleuronectes platessa]|uniref:Uncharacterized protein n=1 Tax=Pleuronectes platessa TaxID=8262 RepID=A0A9N7YBS0_PLEPL|nr:unnamed protein product [Pleuronectes platessa]